MKTNQILKLTTWQSRAIPAPLSILRLFPFTRPAALTIECLTGCLWVTLDRDPKDHILKAGERAEFSGKGLVVTSFAETSIVRVVERRQPQRVDVLEQLLAAA